MENLRAYTYKTRTYANEYIRLIILLDGCCCCCIAKGLVGKRYSTVDFMGKFSTFERRIFYKIIAEQVRFDK